MTFRIDILTPARPIYSGRAAAVTLPTAAGELTILPAHTPLMGQAMAGDLVVAGEAGDRRTFHIGGGGLEVTETGVVVMVERAAAAG